MSPRTGAAMWIGGGVAAIAAGIAIWLSTNDSGAVIVLFGVVAVSRGVSHLLAGSYDDDQATALQFETWLLACVYGVGVILGTLLLVGVVGDQSWRYLVGGAVFLGGGAIMLHQMVTEDQFRRMSFTERYEKELAQKEATARRRQPPPPDPAKRLD